MLAGLWDVVTDPQTSAPLYTFCIITTSSTPALSFLHDRMPVILSSEEDIELWLSGEGWGKGLSGLVRGFEGGVEWYVHFLNLFRSFFSLRGTQARWSGLTTLRLGIYPPFFGQLAC